MTHVDLIEKLLRFAESFLNLWVGRASADGAVVTILPTETETGDRAPVRFAVRFL